MPAPTKTVLLILAGPAGVGKSTLCDRLVSEVPGFERVITATTRAPRPNETDGRDYHFLTEADFDSRLAAGRKGRKRAQRAGLFGLAVAPP